MQAMQLAIKLLQFLLFLLFSRSMLFFSFSPASIWLRIILNVLDFVAHFMSLFHVINAINTKQNDSIIIAEQHIFDWTISQNFHSFLAIGYNSWKTHSSNTYITQFAIILCALCRFLRKLLQCTFNKWQTPHWALVSWKALRNIEKNRNLI